MAETMEAPRSASQTSTQAQSTQTQQEAGKPKEAPAVPDFRGTKHKVKVYDREHEVDYDELLKGYQLKQASHKALEDAATVRKQAEAFLSAVKSKDRKALAQAFGGEDALREYAESLLIEDLELKSLPESERRARAAEARAKELEDWKKEQEERHQREQQTAAEREAGQAIDTEITEAFGEFGAKPTPYLVARVADEMAARLEHGKPITAKQALSLVERSMTAELSEMPPDKLIAKLTPAQIEYVRKHLVDQVMTQQPRRVKAPAGERQASAPKRDMTIEEAFDQKQKAYFRR